MHDADISDQLTVLLNAMKNSETNEQVARVIGSVAGAIATKSSGGAYSGADSAQLVYRNNFDEHLVEPLIADVAADFEAAKNGDKAAQARVEKRTAAAFLIIDQFPVIGTINAFADAETKVDYSLAAITILPGAGPAIKNALKLARQLRKAGKIEEAAKVLDDVGT